jgi:hypothetical protein
MTTFVSYPHSLNAGIAADMAQAAGSIAPLYLGIFGLFNGNVFQVLRNPSYRAELRMTLIDIVRMKDTASPHAEEGSRVGFMDEAFAHSVELNVLEDRECEKESFEDLLSNNSQHVTSVMRLRRREVRLSGEFAFFWAVQTSHSTKTTFSGPGVRLNDGVFTVYLVRPLPRLQLMEIMHAVSEGKHVYHKALRVFQCVSYDLHMLDSDQVVMVDGVQYPCQRMRGDVLAGATHVLTLPNI